VSAVTHTRVREEVVDPAMDGIALNDWQARALYNPTPEVDSALERIEELTAYGVPRDLIDALRNDLWLVIELNGRERQCQRQVAGKGERIARDLRPIDGRQSLKRPALRRTLGPILDVLAVADLDDPRRDFDGLSDALERIIPPRTLRSRSLLDELGRRRADILLRLLGDAA
jgi:hypothetical protein